MTEPIAPAIAETPSGESSPKKPTAMVIAIVAGGLVVLLGLGAAAFALVPLLLGSGQSATASAVAFPHDTVAWVEVAIEPSNGQKLEAFRFIAELDGLRDALEDADVDIDFDDPNSRTDLRSSLWDLIVDGDESSIDTKLDYDDDIAPWIGSRIAFGLLPTAGEDGEPTAIIAIEARDTEAGVDAIEDLIDDLDADANVVVKNGYIVIGSEEIDLDDVFESGTLDESDTFVAASSGSGEWGVASMYVDLGSAISLSQTATDDDFADADYWREFIPTNASDFASSADYEYGSTCDDLDYDENFDYADCEYGYSYQGVFYDSYDGYAEAWVANNLDELVEQKVEAWINYESAQETLREQYDGATFFAVARFTDASFEVSGMSSGIAGVENANGDTRAASNLPDSAVLVVSVADLAQSIDLALSDENLAAATGLSSFSPVEGTDVPGASREEIIEWIDESLGLEFPDDLEVLFGSSITLAIDEDLDLDAANESESLGDGIGELIGSGAALVIASDDTAGTASAWEDLLETLEDSVGESLSIDVEETDGLVIISAGDYLDSVLEPDERLADSDSFLRAVPNSADADLIYYIDVDELISLFEDVAGSTDAFDGLDGIGALGFTTRSESEGATSFVFRVTTDAR